VNDSDMDVEEQDYLEEFRGVSIKMEFILEDKEFVYSSMIAYTIELI